MHDKRCGFWDLFLYRSRLLLKSRSPHKWSFSAVSSKNLGPCIPTIIISSIIVIFIIVIIMIMMMMMIIIVIIIFHIYICIYSWVPCLGSPFQSLLILFWGVYQLTWDCTQVCGSD